MIDEKKAVDLLKDKKEFITSDDILGKDIIDARGHYIGVASQLHIDRRLKNITGISIDTGFNKPLAFVGVDLVTNFGVDAIYISHTPSSRYIGLDVYDKNGALIGRVKSARLRPEKATIMSFIVSLGILKNVELHLYMIKVLGRSIILNITKDEVMKIYHEQKSRSE